MENKLSLASIRVLNEHRFGYILYKGLLKQKQGYISYADFIHCIPTLDTLLRCIADTEEKEFIGVAYEELCSILMDALRLSGRDVLHKVVIRSSNIGVSYIDYWNDIRISFKFYRNKQLKSMEVYMK